MASASTAAAPATPRASPPPCSPPRTGSPMPARIASICCSSSARRRDPTARARRTTCLRRAASSSTASPPRASLASGAKGSLRVIVTHARTRSAFRVPAPRPVRDRAHARRCCRVFGRCALPSDPVLGDTTVNIGDDSWRHRSEHHSRRLRGGADVPPRGRRRAGEGDDRRMGTEIGPRSTCGSYIPAQHFHVDTTASRSRPSRTRRDIPLLGRWGTPLLFGPGLDPRRAHAESTSTCTSCAQRRRRYERIVRALLARMTASAIAPARRFPSPSSAPPAPSARRSSACSPITRGSRSRSSPPPSAPRASRTREARAGSEGELPAERRAT